MRFYRIFFLLAFLFCSFSFLASSKTDLTELTSHEDISFLADSLNEIKYKRHVTSLFYIARKTDNSKYFLNLANSYLDSIFLINSNDEFAIEHQNIHSNFKNYQDTILLIDKGVKKVSSTEGHNLMHNHPFSKERFNQANNNLKETISILEKGDIEKFISVTESEALTLHAMMMTSNPYFILMEEGTLSVIEKVWESRKSSDVPLSFTLDAGANVHLLYPEKYKQSVLNFIEMELIVYCENQQYICDEVGNGPLLKMEHYA